MNSFAPIKSPTSFAKDIEEIVWARDCTYLEAVMLYIEEQGVEVEVAASLIKQSSELKSHITVECEDLKLIEVSAKLILED